MNILITGAAGFIGYSVSQILLKNNDVKIFGVDNLNDYYDVNLKLARLKNLSKYDNFTFYKEDIKNYNAIIELIQKHKITRIIHLAAQAGVRYSLINPRAYIESNIDGFFNMIEAARIAKVERFLYASSSSVYGMVDGKQAVQEDFQVNHPASLYAATKRSNELIAHSYAKLYKLPCIGLRYFTVYGPWGRPDMAIFNFTKKILSNTPIEVFNNGKMLRDFTYIDDVAKSTIAILNGELSSKNFMGNDISKKDEYIPYWIYNIGSNNPIKLLSLIETIEKEIGKKAIKKFLPLQPGDVINTWADNASLKSDFQVSITADIKLGIKNFIQWYKAFYNVEKRDRHCEERSDAAIS